MQFGSAFLILLCLFATIVGGAASEPSSSESSDGVATTAIPHSRGSADLTPIPTVATGHYDERRAVRAIQPPIYIPVTVTVTVTANPISGSPPLGTSTPTKLIPPVCIISESAAKVRGLTIGLCVVGALLFFAVVIIIYAVVASKRESGAEDDEAEAVPSRYGGLGGSQAAPLVTGGGKEYHDHSRRSSVS